MNYEEAMLMKQEDEDATGNSYRSVDFYRVMQTQKVALGLLDKAADILRDVVNHGSPAALACLKAASDYGIVLEHYDELGNMHYDFDNTYGHSYHFNSHIAMQIAFPDLYFEMWGKQIWPEPTMDPLIQQTVDLCISCLTNSQHPSDYYGEHEIAEEGKRGPKPKGKAKGKTKGSHTKAGGEAYIRWVAECQAQKTAVVDAWADYLRACERKKQMEIEGKEWRNSELDRLRAEMANVSKQYHEGMEQFKKACQAAKDLHTSLKNAPKPEKPE